jgi:hypothetical protein
MQHGFDGRAYGLPGQVHQPSERFNRDTRLPPGELLTNFVLSLVRGRFADGLCLLPLPFGLPFGQVVQGFANVDHLKIKIAASLEGYRANHSSHQSVSRGAQVRVSRWGAMAVDLPLRAFLRSYRPKP